MRLVNLGRSGLKVSRLCLGAMMFGGATDEAEAASIISAAADSGCNFIDTADVYNRGASEEIVGRAIAGSRRSWVLATKLGAATGDGPWAGGLSRRWIMTAAEDSLRRLGTDVIDILYFHREDASVPMGEQVRAVADLLRQGKIRHFAVSNTKSWRIAEICRLCDEHGIDRPVASQPCYNAMNRTSEVEHLAACAHFGLGVAPYSPLARGVLTGKYGAGAEPAAGSRAGRGDNRMMQTEWRPESLAAAAKIKARAEAMGTTSTAFAIAWVLANPIISSIIAGPRTLAQFQSYLPGLDLRLGPDDEAFVDALTPPGHASTPGYSDPAYPVEGRPSAA
jgi:aryl-alcohol dehydrogenase-like predicted oxidoreductase